MLVWLNYYKFRVYYSSGGPSDCFRAVPVARVSTCRCPSDARGPRASIFFFFFPVALAFLCISGLVCILGLFSCISGLLCILGLIFICILGCGFFWEGCSGFLVGFGGLLGWAAFGAGLGVCWGLLLYVGLWVLWVLFVGFGF
jgi:hypothetical protein